MVVSWRYAVLAIIVVMAALGLFRRFRTRMLWDVLCMVMLFLGVWFAALLAMPISIALLTAAALTLGSTLFRRVWIHNVFFLVGAAGAAIQFAEWLPPEFLLASLVCVTLYDMVEGIRIVPGVLVPSRLTEVWMRVDDAVKGSIPFLGAGDLILPLALIARAAFHSPLPALVVFIGLLAGVFVAVQRHDLHPREALPSLAAGAALPFLALRVLSLI